MNKKFGGLTAGMVASLQSIEDLRRVGAAGGSTENLAAAAAAAANGVDPAIPQVRASFLAAAPPA